MFESFARTSATITASRTGSNLPVVPVRAVSPQGTLRRPLDLRYLFAATNKTRKPTS